jgi:hypothetical protein
LRARKRTKLILLLTQSPRRDTNSSSAKYPAIGMVVLKGKYGQRACTPLRRGQVVGASKYIRTTHVALEIDITASSDPYTLVASTYEPGDEGNFAIYVYADDEIDILPSEGDRWIIENQDAGETEGNLIIASRRTREMQAARGLSPSNHLPVSELQRAAINAAPRVVAPPPAMLSRFSGSFLQIRNSLLRHPNVYAEYARKQHASCDSIHLSEVSYGQTSNSRRSGVASNLNEGSVSSFLPFPRDWVSQKRSQKA